MASGVLLHEQPDAGSELGGPRQSVQLLDLPTRTAHPVVVVAAHLDTVVVEVHEVGGVVARDADMSPRQKNTALQVATALSS